MNNLIIKINSFILRMQIWDTAGQEKFDAIASTYYKSTDVVLLVYSIDSMNSFERINEWAKQVDDNIAKDEQQIRILIGNKTDLEDERKVPQEEGIALALSHNYKFKETSCMKNENVADSFEALIELWNVEYQKKLASKTSRNSGDFTKKEKTLSRSNTVVNVKKNRLDT